MTVRPPASVPRARVAAVAGAVLTAAAGAVLIAAPAHAQTLEPPPPLQPAPPPGPGPVLVPAPGPAGPPPPPPGTVVLPSTPIMPATQTAAEESEDSGLGLEWVYLNADVGAAYANMQSFSESDLALVKTESGGPAIGVAAGVRLVFFSLGVRVRDLMLSSIGNLWQFSAEAAFHTRIWRIDPYFGVRGGYDVVGSLSADSVNVAPGSNASDVNVHGFDAGPVFGIDGYFSKLVSLGVDIDAKFLFLQRPPLPLPPGITLDLLTPAQQKLYQNSGSSIGFSVTPTVHLGIHF